LRSTEWRRWRVSRQPRPTPISPSSASPPPTPKATQLKAASKASTALASQAQ
jgi:hypothetical protein